MLIADKNCKKNTFRVAALTVASLIIMGYLNALAIHTSDLNAMITAQSGNIIWIGINAG